MPDEQSLSISSSGLSPDDVVRRSFAVVRRGFDPGEVRAYLEQVARLVRAVVDHESELRRSLDDAEHRAAHPVLDEATLAGALGEEAARILRSAHDAAGDLGGRAQEQASRVLVQAREEAARIHDEARKAASLREEESMATSTAARERAAVDAAGIVEEARARADALVARTKDDCRNMIEEARRLRVRVLSDLAERRRVLHTQVEQLRAGRDALMSSLQGARESVDRTGEELGRAEAIARAEAEAARTQAASTVQPLAAEEEIAGGAGPAERALERIEEVPTTRNTPVTPAAVFAEATPTAADAGLSSGGSTGPREQVDELFARLRAERTQPEGPVSKDLASPGLAPGAGQGGASADSGPAGDASAVVGDAAAAGTGVGALAASPAGSGPGVARTAAAAGDIFAARPVPPGAGSVAESVRVLPAEPGHQEARARRGSGRREGAGAEASVEGGPGTVTLPSSAPRAPSRRVDDQDLLREQEMILHPVVEDLAKSLKRALRDDQNDVLDRLRTSGGNGLLPSRDEQADRYRSASRDLVEAAAQAGAKFARTHGGAAVGDEEIAHHASIVADLIADEILTPLRRRIDEGSSAAGPEDADHLAGVVGAAFRAWKGEGIERLAGDQALAAFAEAAALAAAPGQLRWIASRGATACADCDDNALAGAVAVARGERFPTGHEHPPAHAGCRCAVAPAGT